MEKNKTLRNKLKTAAIGLGGLAAIIGATLLGGCTTGPCEWTDQNGCPQFVGPGYIEGRIVEANTPGCFTSKWESVNTTLKSCPGWDANCLLAVESGGCTYHVIIKDYGGLTQSPFSVDINEARAMANDLIEGRSVYLEVSGTRDGYYHLEKYSNHAGCGYKYTVK